VDGRRRPALSRSSRSPARTSGFDIQRNHSERTSMRQRPRFQPGALAIGKSLRQRSSEHGDPAPSMDAARTIGLGGRCHWLCGSISKDSGTAVPEAQLEPSTFRLRDGCSASDWTAPEGSSLLILDASSVQTAPDGYRRIIRMIKRHPTENRMARQAYLPAAARVRLWRQWAKHKATAPAPCSGMPQDPDDSSAADLRSAQRRGPESLALTAYQAATTPQLLRDRDNLGIKSLFPSQPDD
jgi:hypothetical protein